MNSFIRQFIWREFSYYLLYHYPFTVYKPLNKNFEHFPWNNEEELLRVWQKGETGYPFIDAGMQELWQTGFMHNRARMAVASFLVKHLLIPWQEGAKWFMDTLLDADIANNTMGGNGLLEVGQMHHRTFVFLTRSHKVKSLIKMGSI